MSLWSFSECHNTQNSEQTTLGSTSLFDPSQCTYYNRSTQPVCPTVTGLIRFRILQLEQLCWNTTVFPEAEGQLVLASLSACGLTCAGSSASVDWSTKGFMSLCLVCDCSRFLQLASAFCAHCEEKDAVCSDYLPGPLLGQTFSIRPIISVWLTTGNTSD